MTKNVTNVLGDWITANERLCNQSVKEVYAEGMEELTKEDYEARDEDWDKNEHFRSYER